MYIVVLGTTFYGPFENYDQAVEWVEYNAKDYDWEVVELIKGK